MTEHGIVQSIDGKVVTVVLRMMAGCQSCVNSSCKTNRTGVKAYNRDELPIAEGDSVEINIEGKAQLSGALWVLGLPLAIFASGYLLGRLIYPDSGEGPAVLFSVVGLVIGVVIGILVQKGKRLESLPRLTRRIDFAEFEPGQSSDSDDESGNCGFSGT